MATAGGISMNKCTILERSTTSKWIFFLIWSILLGLLGWYLPLISRWAIDHLFDSVGEGTVWFLISENTYMLWIRPVLGVLIALWASFVHFAHQVKIVITDDCIKISYEECKAELKRPDIAAIWLDLNNLREIVFLDAAGIELYREFLPNISTEKIRKAFLQHNYSWKNEDPYKGEYVLWEKDYPGIGKLEEISLTAREKYLKEGEYHKANKIQRKLGREGIMITDKGKRQYIRVVKKKK